MSTVTYVTIDPFNDTCREVRNLFAAVQRDQGLCIRFKREDGSLTVPYTSPARTKIPSQCGGTVYTLYPTDVVVEMTTCVSSPAQYHYDSSFDTRGIHAYNVDIQCEEDRDAVLTAIAKVVHGGRGYATNGISGGTYCAAWKESSYHAGFFAVLHIDRHYSYGDEDYYSDYDECGDDCDFEHRDQHYCEYLEKQRFYSDVEYAGSSRWLTQVTADDHCYACSHPSFNYTHVCEQEPGTLPYIATQTAAGHAVMGITSNLGYPEYDGTVHMMNAVWQDRREILRLYQWQVIRPDDLASNGNENHHYIDGVYMVKRPRGYEEHTTTFDLMDWYNPEVRYANAA